MDRTNRAVIEEDILLAGWDEAVKTAVTEMLAKLDATGDPLDQRIQVVCGTSMLFLEVASRLCQLAQFGCAMLGRQEGLQLYHTRGLVSSSTAIKMAVQAVVSAQESVQHNAGYMRGQTAKQDPEAADLTPEDPALTADELEAAAAETEREARELLAELRSLPEQEPGDTQH